MNAEEPRSTSILPRIRFRTSRASVDLRKALFDLAFNEVGIDGGEQETHTRCLRLHRPRNASTCAGFTVPYDFDLFDNGLPGFHRVIWIHIYSSRLPSVDGIEIIAANPQLWCLQPGLKLKQRVDDAQTFVGDLSHFSDGGNKPALFSTGARWALLAARPSSSTMSVTRSVGWSKNK